MNYLAHVHLANLTNTSVTGNLLGDFVKGHISGLPFDKYINEGVQLHRAVDSYTDKHTFTRSLTSQLGGLRRYGGIIVDVLYDHQLATQFQLFSSISLNEFAQSVYNELDTTIEYLPERYISTITAMKRMDWLSGYDDLTNIHRALTGISKRLKKPVDLTASLEWYQSNQKSVEQNFPDFYSDVVEYCSTLTTE